MSAALDPRDASTDDTPPLDQGIPADHRSHGRPDGTPRQLLSLPEAASKLEQGLWRLVAQGLDDDGFWLAFSGLYRDLTGQLPEAERGHLAYHADYALARLGMPVWTVMAESTQLSADRPEPRSDGTRSVAAA